MLIEMTDAPDRPNIPEEKLYTIGTVAELTGVGPITLRAWERRHGLIQPLRKDSGHRLYTREHIDRINRITALTSQGLRISQIRPDMLEGEYAPGGREAATADAWTDRTDSMLAAVLAFDEVRLEEIYNEALSLHPTELVTARLLKPLLVRLGQRWAAHTGRIAEEHFFTFYLRNKLGARFHHRAHRDGGIRLLLAGLPGEFHEIALLLFALAAHERGYRLLTLGVDTPLGELPYVAARTGCGGIVLSGAIMPAGDVLTVQLPRLVEAAPVPVFVGGQSSVLACEAIVAAGAEALGTDVERGLQRLAARLG